MVGTYGCARADAAANYRMQNPYRSIGMSDRAAAQALNGGSGCPTSGGSGEAKASEALTKASQTGQGITKPELQEIVSRAIDGRGSANKLDRGTRRAIRQAVNDGAFARKSTAQLALQLSQGKISPADIGASFGRAK